ncbi:MarR family winged helix-turn-helix transcriptional regulator [Leifsonia naganoensis]|uniref:DNA-binding MarR family transcriptional regulator n=1 Tax=Leifsonia naganoensis TaxID=150025 RepID=A0A853DWL0_9MICO|nr:MarR family transcriptional regulator [Leifsonia naganoensis]NYK10405.1 DNA-binding MarR family transcriptional regulator [Leifsonia naganoensis]
MPPADIPALETRASFLLSQLGLQSAQRFTAALAPLGITPNRFGVLAHLSHQEGRTQQELATALGLHRNSMVGMIDDLEARGLVERRRHPDDRRAYAIHLTPAAREVLVAGDTLADELERTTLAALDEAERTALIATLTKLAATSGYPAGVHPGLDAPARSTPH